MGLCFVLRLLLEPFLIRYCLFLIVFFLEYWHCLFTFNTYENLQATVDLWYRPRSGSLLGEGHLLRDIQPVL